MTKTILHVDLNSFFATCQQQDNPEFRGAPLGIAQDTRRHNTASRRLPIRPFREPVGFGGQGGKRSVIIGSSREAKMIGIDTGAMVWEARRIYPEIAVVPAKFERFVHYARLLRKICQHYTDQVEVFSVDELFMDISASIPGSLEGIALDIKRRVRVEMGRMFTVSIGVAANKMLAKLASGSFKPDGLKVITEKNKLEFLDQHPLWHICGIGDRIPKSEPPAKAI